MPSAGVSCLRVPRLIDLSRYYTRSRSSTQYGRQYGRQQTHRPPLRPVGWPLRVPSAVRQELLPERRASGEPFVSIAHPRSLIPSSPHPSPPSPHPSPIRSSSLTLPRRRRRRRRRHTLLHHTSPPPRPHPRSVIIIRVPLHTAIAAVATPHTTTARASICGSTPSS